MSFIQRIIEALDARLWKFIRIVHSANHDYPYHDFIKIENESENDVLYGSYAVGTNNINAHGDQSKRFVSKRANIWATKDATTIRFNDSRNVEMELEPILVDDIGGIVRVGKEYHTNVAVVYYAIATESYLYMYFEGVLPEEARDAE